MSNYLIIGGSSAIGKELARQLALEGHKVFATYYSSTPNDEEILIEYHPFDVLSDPVDFRFLPERLDGLAYCPGSINLRPFSRIKAEDFVQDYELQVVGAVKTIQAVLPSLKRSEQGSIVLFSTVAVQSGFPFHSQVAASKGAIEGLTRALAAELAPGIRVNCIAPSLTDTPLASKLLGTEAKREANAQRHPLKRIGKPEDIASMAHFLLSGPSTWISGQVFQVDGGMSSLKV